MQKEANTENVMLFYYLSSEKGKVMARGVVRVDTLTIIREALGLTSSTMGGKQ